MILSRRSGVDKLNIVARIGWIKRDIQAYRLKSSYNILRV
jgi:hypothetical protein